MTLCLFEDAAVSRLAPLALTRAAFDLRTGAWTGLEAAQDALGPDRLVLHTRRALRAVTAERHPDAADLPETGGVLFLNGRVRLAPGGLAEALRGVARPGEPARAFVADTPDGKALVALWHPAPDPAWLGADAFPDAAADGAIREAVDPPEMLHRLWDVTARTSERVALDIVRLGGLGLRDGTTVHDGAHLIFPRQIHLAPGARVLPGAVLDATDGPIHVAAGATVEPNAVLRGPVCIGPASTVKALARVSGSATGAHVKLGGEVNESVVQGVASKAHDGYLGNSYLGAWANVGAASDTSNLRNDYGEVTLWDPVEQAFLPSGRQFLGLVFADHAKCAIHTAFSTGTVVGVASNVFGSDVPPRHVPSFAWGGGEGLVPYRVEKALEVARAVMARRSRTLAPAAEARLREIAASDAAQG